MNKLVTAFALVGCMGLVGGLAVGDPRGYPKLPADNSFEFDPPRSETIIRHGESKTITIVVTRGKIFVQDVRIEFRGLPPGLKATSESDLIPCSQPSFKVTLEATREAALGGHTITVIGTPEPEGARVSATFDVVVKDPERPR